MKIDGMKGTRENKRKEGIFFYTSIQRPPAPESEDLNFCRMDLGLPPKKIFIQFNKIFPVVLSCLGWATECHLSEFLLNFSNSNTGIEKEYLGTPTLQ